MKQKRLGGGDYSWMYNTRGIRDGVTVPLNVAAFTKANHYPNDYFPCGLPVKLNGLNGAEPWVDEPGAKLGFVGGDFDLEEAARGVHVITHPETVKTNRLPVTFTAPTSASVAHINFVEA